MGQERTMERTTQQWYELGEQTNSPSYAPASMILDHGQGVRVTDLEGKEYLDFVAGIAVNGLGYNHPRLLKALDKQSRRLWHVSNMFYTAEQIALMEALTERSFADRVFLCNSGAEANEAAIKLARRYQYEAAKAPERVEIVTMLQSFHGRTMGALSATGQPKYHKGFGPMLPGFVYAEFNNLESVISCCNERTAAVMVEPIQGEGGVIPATPEFLKGLEAYCREQGILLIFDEVQAGMGRTGSLFAHQHYGVTPDIFTIAKALGGGFPMGAMLASAKVFEGGWTRGSHATTFGGNPLGSAIAREVIAVIEDEGLCEQATARGQQLQEGLRALMAKYPVIKDVRGVGLMVGAECGEDAAKIVGLARDRGLLINTAGGNTLRFVPPLVITQDDVSQALKVLDEALAAL